MENNSLKLIFGICSVFVYLPISLYITYVLLKNADVDRLVWFLFIINIPLVIFITILKEIVTNC